MKMVAILAALDAEGVPRIEAETLIEGVFNLAYWAAGITAVIAIIIGGILYIVSDGDSSKIKRAKETIIYGIIGLVFVMAAATITALVAGRF